MPVFIFTFPAETSNNKDWLKFWKRKLVQKEVIFVDQSDSYSVRRFASTYKAFDEGFDDLFTDESPVCGFDHMLYSFPKDCCGGFGQMNFSVISLPEMRILWTDLNLWISIATIVFHPVFWNLMARWEYRTKGLSKRIGNRYLACWVLAAMVFSVGIFRDIRFSAALNSQPRWYTLQQNHILWLGYAMISIGTVFVLTSYYALGFYGTFLGDYFGILMDHKVTSFPFNVLDNPMYWGSFLNFVGASLVKASQSGLLLCIVIAICYKVAIFYEGPFTAKIYAEKAQKLKLDKLK